MKNEGPPNRHRPCPLHPAPRGASQRRLHRIRHNQHRADNRPASASHASASATASPSTSAKASSAASASATANVSVDANGNVTVKPAKAKANPVKPAQPK